MMTLLCPLCMGVNFSSEESLLYDLISSATRSITCPLCQEILRGFDKFTIHLCSHILKCDSSPIALKIDENVINLNEKLENIHLHRNCESQTVDLHSFPFVESGSNTTLVTNYDGNSNQVPPQTNYLAQFTKEYEIRNENQPIGLEIGNIFPPSPPNISFNENLDFDLETLLRSENTLRPERTEILTNERNILHVDFSNENVPVTVIPNEEKITNDDGNDNKNNECILCSTSFPSNTILTLHNELVHGENDKSLSSFKYRCNQCQKKFKIKGSLLIHQQVAHRSSAEEKESIVNANLLTNDDSHDKGDVQYRCNICFKSFKKEYYLNQHLKVHEGKQWNCDECGKMFTTKYFLKKHKRLHTGEMPHYCSICDKHFTFQQSFHRHISYHNTEKPYSCEECGRSFKELSTLYNHQRIHTGEKPYSCHVCGKTFRQRVTCLVHSRIHTGSQPYKCSHCQKSFRYKVSLRNHKCNVVQTEHQE